MVRILLLHEHSKRGLIETYQGTSVEGTAKRELSDAWVPAQLWILTKTDSNTYAVQNGNSRTYLAVTDGTSAWLVMAQRFPAHFNMIVRLSRGRYACHR